MERRERRGEEELQLKMDRIEGDKRGELKGEDEEMREERRDRSRTGNTVKDGRSKVGRKNWRRDKKRGGEKGGGCLERGGEEMQKKERG